MTRKTLFILFIILCLFSISNAKTWKLYYLGGQSNMDGQGYVNELPAELDGPVPGVMIFHSQQTPDNLPVNGKGLWSVLKPGHGTDFKSDGVTNQYGERFGVELTFARELQKLEPDANIAIIKYSRGGSSLHIDAAGRFGCWDPDFSKGNGVNQYDHFLATLRNALSVQDIDGDGETDILIPAGIVWMQGESDACWQETAQTYEQNLKRIMDLIRSALRVDDLPVVIGRISDSGDDSDGKVWDYGDVVRQAQADYCDSDACAALVTTTDNYGYSDKWHYDSAGYIDLGRQFARAIYRLENPDSSAFLLTYFHGNGDGLHLVYSFDGLTWNVLNNDKPLVTPQVGKDKLMRDPCIIEGPDGLYHMVWTVSWAEKGIGYASSPDLVHWSEQKYIPVMEHEEKAENCWAPEIFYDDTSMLYYIFWSTTIPGRFPETDNQSNDGPPAPGRNHRIYYVTTNDFNNFSDTRLFFNPGYNVIDATLIKHDGQYIMFFKDETNKPFVPQKNIKMAFSEQAKGPYGNITGPITGDYWCEGPSVVKTGEYWMVYFDKYRQHKYGVVRSRDLKNWEDISDQMVHPDDMRHGTVLKAPMKVLNKLLELN